MIELLDYILDYNDNFWIVEKIDNEILKKVKNIGSTISLVNYFKGQRNK